MTNSNKIALILGLAAVAAPQAALAQIQPDDAASRVEGRLERLPDRVPAPARAPAAAAEAEGPWSLEIGSPFRLATNSGLTETGAKSAGYFDPSVTLARDWDFGGGTLSFESGADMQIFTSQKENDLSVYYANLRLSLGSGKVQPYFDYTLASLYAGQFSSHLVTLHEFTAGTAARVPVGSSDSLSIDANITRREATVDSIEINRVGLTLAFRHRLSDKDRLVLVARGRFLDYSAGASSNRSDTNAYLAATYQIDLDKHWTVDVKAIFERNWSNTADKSYSAFDIGPAITFNTNF